MKRRHVLAAAGVGIAAGALLGRKEQAGGADAATPGAEAKTFNWKMVTSWPRNFPGVGAERFARRVEQMSNGRLKIKV